MPEQLLETSAVELHDKPREACGVFGIFVPGGGADVARITVAGIYELQHRGQDAAGVAVNGLRGIVCEKNTGLVTEVFPDGGRTLDLREPRASVAVGHVRYSTVESASSMPLMGTGFALSHNGEFTNTTAIANKHGIDLASEDSDTEVVTKALDKVVAEKGDFTEGLCALLPELEGAFSLVLTDGKQLVGVRDPNGYRPLSIGTRMDGGYVLSSETAPFKKTEAVFLRDVQPGEIVFIDETGITSRAIDKPADPKGCAFEFVYLARRDSIIAGRSVHSAREQMGMNLADEAPAQADIVVAVPETAASAAMGFAKQSGIPYDLGLDKNPYANRTFIQKADRGEAVRLKMRPNDVVVEGKRLVLVDDSIVRGTTMRVVIDMLREAGALEVHLRIPCPPYRWPCFYGMDTKKVDDFLAHNRTEDEMCEFLGADSLKFLSNKSFEAAIGLPLGSLCMACLDGNYPTPVPDLSLSLNH